MTDTSQLTASLETEDVRPAPRARTWPVDALAPLVAWTILVGGSFAWGAWLTRRGHEFALGSPPLYGRFVPRFSVFTVPALALGAAVIAFGPYVARRLPWRSLLVTSAVTAGAWGAALAAIDGVRGLRVDGRLRSDFLATVPMVHHPAEFVARFTRDLATFSDHAHGHPPGLPLLLWALNALGLGGVRWDTTLRLVAFSAAIPAVEIAIRELAGEQTARKAAPFLFVAPFAAMGVAITADAVFAALTAWAIALFVLGTGRTGWRSDAFALAGGLLFGWALYSTYGAFVVGVIPAAVAIQRRRVRPVLVAAAGVLCVAGAFLYYGFWWVSGLRMTWFIIAQGARRERIASYFIIGNLAAFAVALGPVVAPAVARLRDKGTWLLVGSALGAVALADVSQFSRAEVERIWLPIAIWVMAAASVLGARFASRRWLVPHVCFALLVASLIRATW